MRMAFAVSATFGGGLFALLKSTAIAFAAVAGRYTAGHAKRGAGNQEDEVFFDHWMYGLG